MICRPPPEVRKLESLREFLSRSGGRCRVFGMKATPLIITLVAFFVGVVVTTQAAPKQTLCPLMIECEIDEEEFIIYKGVKVFTCCVTCKKMW